MRQLLIMLFGVFLFLLSFSLFVMFVLQNYIENILLVDYTYIDVLVTLVTLISVVRFFDVPSESNFANQKERYQNWLLNIIVPIIIVLIIHFVNLVI